MSYPKSLREKLQITLSELSALIGCKESTLSMTESGKRSLPLESLNILNVLKEIVDETSNETDATPDYFGQTELDKMEAPRLEMLAAVTNELEKKEKKLMGNIMLLKMDVLIEKKSTFPADSLSKLQWSILCRKAKKEIEQLTKKVALLRIKKAALAAELFEIQKLRKI